MNHLDKTRQDKTRQDKTRQDKTYVGIKQSVKAGYAVMEIGGVADFIYPTSNNRRGRVQGRGQICPTLTAQSSGVCRVEKNELDIKDGILRTNKSILGDKDAPEVDWESCEYRIRKLTAKECYRLMDVSDTNADKMLAINSQTQCYKQAGNSIVCSVLCAIFSQLNIQGIKPWNERTDEEKRALLALGK